ncbi:related to brt1 protein [Rhynchosporium agropyri]|uniref:Related to brt1 protein n=3 Tax=Rhynchosporium TaxID=38037 RepID=A0A1E1MBT1_RHYSE|nr:related to brt1 protein [Rhynchosporium agropyri]CZT01994.1 related to brt1 protein [Rhynchosporium commune]CZT46543.1 related to brt1 protein [Rhynchosporium secalis]
MKSSMKSFIDKRRLSHQLPRPTIGELRAENGRKLISSGSEFEAVIGYSRAVVTGSWIEVSGTTGVHYDTGFLAPTIVEQTEQAFINIAAALDQAGATLRDVVRVRYILPDKKEFCLIWPTLRAVWGTIRPAATMMEAGLMNDEMKIEIEVTARKFRPNLEGTV